MADRKVKQWITINGVHVPIYEGESKQDAVKRAIGKAQDNAKANEDQKAKDIAKNKAEKDKLNGKDDFILKDEVPDLYPEAMKYYKAVSKDDYNSVEDQKRLSSNVESLRKSGKITDDDAKVIQDHIKNKISELQKAGKEESSWKKELGVSSNNKSKYAQAGLDENKVKEFIRNNPEARKIANDLLKEGRDFDEASIWAYKSYKNANKGSLFDPSSGKTSDEAREKKDSNYSFKEQAKSIVAKEKDSWKNIKTTPQALSNIRYLSKHELKDIPDGKLKEMYPYHKNQVGVEIAEELLNRGYQKVGSGWQIKVPKSFAANYPNLSSSQLKVKYEEYLKKNRK